MAGSKISPIGAWVEKLFNDMAYQPNDELSVKVLDDSLSPDAKLTINGNAITADMFKKAVADARSEGKMVLKSSREELAIDTKVDSHTSMAAILQEFSHFSEKKGGEQKNLSLAICTVETVDGQKRLTAMTEIVRSGERW